MPKREMITTRTPILLHYRLKIDDKSNENEIRRQQIQQQKAGEAGTAKSQYAVIARFLVPESRAVITEIYYKHAAKSLGDVADVFFRIDPKPGLTLQKNLRTLTIDGVLPLCIQGKTHIRDKLLSLQRNPDFRREVLVATHHQTESPRGKAQVAARRSELAACLLEDFLSTTEGPLAEIAKAFRQAVLENRLRPLLRNTTLLEKNGSISDSDLGRPRLYTTDDCWFTTPSERILEGIVIANIARGEIRRRGEAHIISGDEKYRVISEVIRCLYHPDPQGTPYVFNIPIEDGHSYAMRVPEELSVNQGRIWESQDSLGAVLSPQFSFTDLHIDSGTQVLSTVLGSCVKLWVCYPPTTSNLDLMYKVGDAEHKFITLSPLLLGGVYVITANKEAIHLPCGWLHAVYTLSGGVLVGINWVSETDIMTSEQYFMRESANGACSSKDITGFVYTLELASQSVDVKRQQRSLETWCRHRNTLIRLMKLKHHKGFEASVRALEKNMLGLGPMACQECGKSAHSHGKMLR